MNTGRLRIINDSLLVSLALVSVGLLIFEMTSDVSAETLALIRGIDLGVALVFGLEFIIRLFETKDRKAFLRENWWQILASIPVTASGTQALRGLMLLRTLRIVRATAMVARVSLFSRSLGRILKETHMALIVTLLAVILIGGSLALYYFEAQDNVLINTFYDSFWYISGVMTNTGVAEIHPVTAGGRAVGIVAKFGGVITFGLFVAFIASHLVHEKTNLNHR